MTDYLTLDDALLVAERFGFVVADPGLLASALARPATSVFGTDAYPTLPRKAAALLESIVRNHPFADGNKRSGWTLTMTFLYLNGHVHTLTEDEGFDLVIGVAEGRLDIDSVERILDTHLIRK